MSDREKVKKAIVSFCFEACQPDRGDVFAWIDDYAAEMADFILAKLSKSE